MKKEIKKGSARNGQAAKSKPTSRTNGKANPAADEAGTIDKVRELLFGQSVREMDHQVVEVQDRMLAILEDARQESMRRFDQLEAYIKAENKALQDSVHQESKNRAAALAKVDQSLGKLNEDLASEATSRESAASDLRDRILQQGKELSDTINQTAATLKGDLTRESSKLNQNLASRADLAKMFSELAIQLADQE